MLILGIETSCDETAAAIVEDGCIIRSNIVSSQVSTHQPYGGIVPELASREHIRNIVPVVEQALQTAGVTFQQIDGIGVTYGPGLVGSLLVGLSYAKSLAFALNKPFVGVNHLEGHIYSVVFENGPIEYPALALLVSGGHTELYAIPEAEHYQRLGHTRDDAAGEAFDKVAKLLGLGYPGGPIIDRLSQHGNAQAVAFTMPRMSDGTLDFSFSGLKTAVRRYVQERGWSPPPDAEHPPQEIIDLAASFQRIVVKTLLHRVSNAIEQVHPRTIILAGGVACNTELRREGKRLAEQAGIPLYVPSPMLTTDNAAMIAAAAYPKLARGERADYALTAVASLKLHRPHQAHNGPRHAGRFKS
ncbi:MAG: tRNA (adenosine(37)-N6)-threonylcarbamoyltransferase complex transferase subunit TsaD [Acidobacteriota bacterium]|nr:tRNA (adenosine(37)-N6)-threonylcarbamoyltransferase complex transferase subunit TsaD [Blastocatellia bacterium]MDW8238426.1 tRNA (adenosine(37)-N6)-threonylcarbamoyltransferase complex transferase subunit TsaD [Acidobacteriota bacterium]